MVENGKPNTTQYNVTSIQYRTTDTNVCTKMPFITLASKKYDWPVDLLIYKSPWSVSQKVFFGTAFKVHQYSKLVMVPVMDYYMIHFLFF